MPRLEDSQGFFDRAVTATQSEAGQRGDAVPNPRQNSVLIPSFFFPILPEAESSYRDRWAS